MDADVAEINAGRARRKGNTFEANGRLYGLEPGGRLYPVSGPGFHLLDRGAHNGLRIYNIHGDTPEAERLLDLNRIAPEARAEALRVWQLGKGL